MIRIITGIAILLLFASCKKETEKLATASIHDYYPIAIGHYITYNLDSTLFIDFGKRDTVIHYQAKDVVDAAITDNLGRPSYRVIRYLRQEDAEPWVASSTYMVTPTEKAIEVVENNLRFIKLAMPVRQDFSWKGNSHIDTYSPDADLTYLADWDYIYDSIGIPLTMNSLVLDSTLKVFERDELLGQDPSIPGTQYAERNYAVEKYANGIGLIYRELIHWEYQGAEDYYVGYGIKMTITGHN